MGIINRLLRDFYTRDAITVAKELLGKYIVNEENGIHFKITETEAYTGPEDKACHAYGGKVTKRNSIMFSEGGYAYVYLIYGMYYCFNITTDSKDFPSAVLIRAGEADIDNLDKIAFLRFKKNYKDLSSYQKKNLLNGPGKFCMGLDIDKKYNGLDICGEHLYLYGDEKMPSPFIKCGKRINIDYAEEYVHKLWRFYI